MTDTSQHQFQLTVTGMSPGEVRQISTGATVVAQATVASGQQLTNTINLPALYVAADHIISIDPASQSSPRGSTATYEVSLTNSTATDEMYILTLDGLDGMGASLVASVDVASGATVQVPLTVNIPDSATAGTFGFVVNVQTQELGLDSVEGSLTVTPDIALPTEAVVVDLSPTTAVAGPNTPATYQVLVTNTGDQTTTYNLSGAFPAGFTGSFASPTVTVPAGVDNLRVVLLTITPPPDASAGTVPFTVTATASTDPAANSTAPGSVHVVIQGVNVTLSPSSGAPGSTFQMTVTNSGTATDTFDLTLAGPAGLIATLGTKSVTLAPGASQVVPVTTTANTGFALSGSLGLTAIATSRANPSILDAATSNLTVPGTTGLDTSLTPSTKILPIPGTTSFLLQVSNTGNTADSYQAVITGTTGPIDASLMGVEGNATQTIPLFRLPGLSTGVILINTNLLGLGDGTVTVRVTSLSDPTLTATRTATVSADQTQIGTTTDITVDHNPANAGGYITFTATVHPVAGTGLPTGNVGFTVDGLSQGPTVIQIINGVATATFTTSIVQQPGTVHQVSASYRGDVNYAYSVSPTIDELLNRATSTTTLDVTPSQAGSNDTVVLTASVLGNWPSEVTGTVTFYDGDRVLATLPAGYQSAELLYGAIASLPASALGTGSHSLRATYSGDAVFLSSVSNDQPLVVTAPETPPPPTPPADGPQVVGLERFGYHMMPTTIVVHFDSSLDTIRAQDLSNYHITNALGRPIGVRSAVYDPAAETVTLTTRQRLNIHRHYDLVINGATQDGLANTNGKALDGDSNGTPGGNNSARIDRRVLVLNRPTPTVTHPFQAARVHAKALQALAQHARLVHQAEVQAKGHRVH